MVVHTQGEVDDALDRCQNAGPRGAPPAAIRQLLKVAREAKVRLPAAVARFGSQILSQSPGSLKPDELWLVHEQVAVACLDSGDLDAAKGLILKLDARFPDSNRVHTLKGMYLEAVGQWDKADEVYASVLEESEANQPAWKRRAAAARARGDVGKAERVLNEYLAVFSADAEAWEELASLHTQAGRLKQAAFCYEELILAAPQNPRFHLRYADLTYAQGGVARFRTALAYYALALDLCGGASKHALFGISACGAHLQAAKGQMKITDEESVLVANAKKSLSQLYRLGAPALLGHCEAATSG